MGNSKRERFKNYKYCLVPLCPSTTAKTPNKLFFSVPKGEKLRKKWCRVIRRDTKRRKLSATTSLYCCEDHFTLEDDMESYWQHRLAGNMKQHRLKEGVLPHRFECQSRNEPKPERSYIQKRRRTEVLSQAFSETYNWTPKQEGTQPDDILSDVSGPFAKWKKASNTHPVSTLAPDPESVKKSTLDVESLTEQFQPSTSKILSDPHLPVRLELGLDPDIVVKQEICDSDEDTYDTELVPDKSASPFTAPQIVVKEEMFEIEESLDNEMFEGSVSDSENVDGNVPKIKKISLPVLRLSNELKQSMGVTVREDFPVTETITPDLPRSPLVTIKVEDDADSLPEISPVVTPALGLESSASKTMTKTINTQKPMTEISMTTYTKKPKSKRKTPLNVNEMYSTNSTIMRGYALDDFTDISFAGSKTTTALPVSTTVTGAAVFGNTNVVQTTLASPLNSIHVSLQGSTAIPGNLISSSATMITSLPSSATIAGPVLQDSNAIPGNLVPSSTTLVGASLPSSATMAGPVLQNGNAMNSTFIPNSAMPIQYQCPTSIPMYSTMVGNYSPSIATMTNQPGATPMMLSSAPSSVIMIRSPFPGSEAVLGSSLSGSPALVGTSLPNSGNQIVNNLPGSTNTMGASYAAPANIVGNYLPTSANMIGCPQVLYPFGSSSNLISASIPDLTNMVQSPLSNATTSNIVRTSLPDSTQILNNSLVSSTQMLNNSVQGSAQILNNSVPGSTLIYNNAIPGSTQILSNSLQGSAPILNNSVASSTQILNNSVPGSIQILNNSVPSFTQILNNSVPGLSNMVSISTPTANNSPSDSENIMKTLLSSANILRSSLPISANMVRSFSPIASNTVRSSSPIPVNTARTSSPIPENTVRTSSPIPENTVRTSSPIPAHTTRVSSPASLSIKRTRILNSTALPNSSSPGPSNIVRSSRSSASILKTTKPLSDSTITALSGLRTYIRKT